jgi:hypothetical protein
VGLTGGEGLVSGEILEVGERGRALLRLPDSSELWLNAGTALRLVSSATERVVHLVRGELLALMEKQRRAFRVLTAEGEVRVMGTVFSAWSQPGQATRVSVLSGRVEVSAAAHRREIGARRRVELSGQRGLGRTGRLSLTEMRRLSGWTGPMRPASRASEGRVLEFVRRKAVMNLMGKVALLIAGVVVAALILSPWRVSSPPTLAEQWESAQARLASAQPLEISEPVDLSFTPSPGDRWTQTTLAHCDAEVLATNRIDERLSFDVRVVSEAQVREGSGPGELVVEHTVTEAAIDLGQWQGQGTAERSAEEQARRMEGVLRRIRVIETLGPEGERQGVQMVGLESGDLELQLTLPGLFAAPAIPPGASVHAGATWNQEQRSIGFDFGEVETTSTLDRFESLGDQRLAVVVSQGHLSLSSPIGIGVRRVTRPWMQMRMQDTLTGCDILWTQETRHLLDSGFPISETGHIEQRFELQMQQLGDSPRPWRGNRSAEITVDSITEYERRP